MSEAAQPVPSPAPLPMNPVGMPVSPTAVPHLNVYHVIAGAVFGIFGGATSLLFNIIGALLINMRHPMMLIQVYLTFPWGESALLIENEFMVGMGCLLYLGTGMLLGVPVYLVLCRWFTR